MLNIDQFLPDMYTKGFHEVDIITIMANFPSAFFHGLKKADNDYKTHDPKERLESLSRAHRDSITSLGRILSFHVFGRVRHDLFFNDLWDGVGQNVRDFHNDFDEYHPLFTASLNVYLDDSFEETGGLLQFSQDKQNVLGELYPKRNRAVILNQSQDWFHRVSPCTAERRMISFKLALPDLMPNIFDRGMNVK